MQGLERGRFALISKSHHALVDGISGVDLMTVLFDATPIPQVAPHEGEPWAAAREPGPLQLAARGVKGLARLPFELAGGALSAATHPAESLDTVKEALEGIGEVAWAGLNPAPETPLNVPIGPHRRLSFVRNDLSDLKLVKNALGGTVNDVVLTVVAGGLRSWLRSRGVRTEGLELRALVPVSVRSKDQHHELGNRIVVMRGPLPVYVEDPVARLRVVRQAMDGLKDSKQAVGAEVITGLEALAPPTILAQASRLQFSTRLFNLLVTNVPGPAVPALRARSRARGPVPGRVPAREPVAGRRDHVLQRPDGLRPARRLRRDARPRGARRRAQGVAGRARRGRGRPQAEAPPASGGAAQARTGLSEPSAGRRISAGSLKTSSNSRWKFGDSEPEIGGIIQDHSASTGQPFFSSDCVHLWNFWAAVWWSSMRMPALS